MKIKKIHCLQIFAMVLLLQFLPCFGLLKAQVRGDRPVDIYTGGEQITMVLTLPSAVAATTTTPAAGQSNVTWKVRDWLGNVQQTGSVQLPSGPLVKVTLAIQPLPSGWYEVAYEVNGRPSGTRTFVTGELYRSKGEGFRFGICAHMMRTENEDSIKMTELLKAMGVDSLRFEIPWASVQRGPDSPFQFEKHDAILRTMTKLGIEPMVLLDYGVSWASTAPAGTSDAHKYNYAPQMEHWLAYVRACVERYGKNVRYWEVWNEPDIGFWRSSTDAYIDLFARTSEEITKLDPGAQVLNGGLAMVSREPNRDFYPQFMAKADRKNWAVMAYHDYMTVAENRERFAMARDQMRKNGYSLPMWINEGGFHTLMPGGERAQAILLVKKIALSAAQGVRAYFWYDLRDDGEDAKETEHHFGLTRRDFQPKPAFAAYREMIRHLADRPVLPGNPGTDGTICVASFGPRKLAGETSGSVHVVWREVPGPEEPMWISSDATEDQLQVFDMMGRPVGGDIAGRGLCLISNIPVYIRAVKGAKLEVKKVLQVPERVVMTPASLAATPGNPDTGAGTPATITAKLTNPYSVRTEISAILQWRSKAGGDNGSVGKASPITPVWTQTLEPGETKTVEFIADTARFLELLNNQQGKGELAVRFGAEATPQIVELPFEIAQQIGTKEAPWSVDLHDRSHIRNLHEAEPTPAIHWSGAEDLSAQASLSADAEDGFRLVVNVKDNVQRQDFESAALWKGDSVQIVLAPLDTPDQFVELTVGLNKKGAIDGWVNRAPAGGALKAGPLPLYPQQAEGIRLRVERQESGAQTRYEIAIPLALLGKDITQIGKPFLFNFLVNDDDGGGRKQWLHYTPGIGENKNPRQFKAFILPALSNSSSQPSLSKP
ncbi:MAG TPA: hypothetical protein VK970_16485 [Candidatus Methylacidiphilales bacterium]|nr:hypothetical protein [Candidatus Methylacidiphilales bacterium]